MIRGIGDPLVSAYARCYLVRMGISVSNNREYMKESFFDFLATYHTVRNFYSFNYKKYRDLAKRNMRFRFITLEFAQSF
jgi:hypothetical protein